MQKLDGADDSEDASLHMVAASEQGDCAVCFEALESRGGAIPLPCECKVNYCADCWDRSLAASISACGRACCPSCRGAMRVDFDSSKGRLMFSRAPFSELAADAPEDDWRRRLYAQAKPRQIELLRRFGAQREKKPTESSQAIGVDASERDSISDSPSAVSSTLQPARCVCGSRLSEVSVRDRVLAFVQEESPFTPPRSVVERLMQTPPIVCDICSHRVQPASKVWTCENGRRTVLHAVAYDVCESCFAEHAYGIERAPSEEGGDFADDYGSDDDACSEESEFQDIAAGLGF